MPLFENSPYTNFESLNLDWILQIIKELEARVTAVEARTTAIEQHLTEIDQQIIDIQGDITNINETIEVIQGDIITINETIENLDIDEINQKIIQIEEILANLDVEAIWQAIETNNDQSIARDDDLARRIALLEQATINPINQYLGTENMVLFGSDFRHLPEQAINEYGLPFGMMYGNSEMSQASTSLIKATPYGLTADQDVPTPSGTDYHYWTLQLLPDMPRSSNTLATHITVTFAVSSSQNPNVTPTLHSHTIGSTNQNITLDWLGGLYLHLDSEQTPRDHLVLDIRGTGATAKLKEALNGKWITYIRVEYGDASSGLHYNEHDSSMISACATYQGQLSPSDVEQIVHDNLEDIVAEQYFNEAYDVTLEPADGSHAYAIDAELDLRLTWKLGFISGILAINVEMDDTAMDIDLSKMFDMNVNISALLCPAKTINADTIHFFSDLFTGAQFDCVLSNSGAYLGNMRVWGAMRPIHLTGTVGEKKTIAVIKIFEPSDWTEPTPN